MAENYEGGCQCGAIRFATSGKPKFVSYCHCTSCRKATGAVFSTWVGFEQSQIRWTTNTPNIFASSPGVERGYCQHCGTPLSYAGEKWPDEQHLLIGVFDTPEAFRPTGEFAAEEALPWAHERPKAATPENS